MILLIFETEQIEFKSQFIEDLYKEIIAFANTDGGIVYIGIDNEGHVIGLENVDKEYTRSTNGIRDAIQPDVTIFVKFRLQENKVVKITVKEGSNKPYHLKSKGLKPSDVYVRQGTSSVPASEKQIFQMMKEKDTAKFEDMTSKKQTLDFASTTSFFQKLGIEFGQDKFISLGLFDETRNFTNLALLLSDQCKHTIKIAVFSDKENTQFLDAKVFKGSLFQQFEEAGSYLTLCNKTCYEFNQFERIEKLNILLKHLEKLF